MIDLWVHLVTWLVLVVVASIAVLSKNNPLSKGCMMLARVCYVVAIGSGIPLVQYAFQDNALLTVLKVILALILIGLIEMTFARKKRHTLSNGFAFVTVLLTILLGLFGMYLAGGFPF